MRLAKHLAHAGVASRRAAERLIADGRVTVDGLVAADPARDVSGAERIEVDGEPIGRPKRERVVYALNKPAGVVSTASDTHGRLTVVELARSAGAPQGRRLYPVGRLDADSTGLILLTDDGELAHRLTHPSFEVTKTYRVRVGGARIGDGALRALRAGVELEDGRTAPARVRRVGSGELELVLREGRKRQVRRMCEAVGHPVLRLRRVGIGPLELGGLAEGRTRRLTPAEVDALRRAAKVA
ncbi:MAG: rRNA pseudouridine synthase [Solirubrobacteraceae bacterium]|nr:rRNA pseudouridine synthase [Solirubrobacteraceae bacterium]